MSRDLDGSRICNHGHFIDPGPVAPGAGLDSIRRSRFGLFVTLDTRSGQNLSGREGMMSFQRISRF
jgi:hypothetical protein